MSQCLHQSLCRSGTAALSSRFNQKCKILATAFATAMFGRSRSALKLLLISTGAARIFPERSRNSAARRSSGTSHEARRMPLPESANVSERRRATRHTSAAARPVLGVRAMPRLDKMIAACPRARKPAITSRDSGSPTIAIWQGGLLLSIASAIDFGNHPCSTTSPRGAIAQISIICPATDTPTAHAATSLFCEGILHSRRSIRRRCDRTCSVYPESNTHYLNFTLTVVS
jgi:hypothetical protein